MIFLLIVSVFLGVCMDILLMKTLKSERYPCTFIIGCLAMVLLYKAFDSYFMIIKGFLLAQILIFAGYTDIKTRLISDKVHVAILIIALAECNLVNSILGLVFVPLPFLLAALVKKGGMGGGDIKLMGACGFLLGVINGYVASVIGLAIAILFSKMFLKNTASYGIPLAPFLGIGCFLTYLIH